MVTFVLSADSVGAGPRFTFSASGDSYIIREGLLLVAQIAEAISFGGFNNLSVDLGGLMSSAAFMTASGTGIGFSVADTGRFVSFETDQTRAALFFSGGLSRVTNAGEFISERSVALATNGGCDVVNNGLIAGASGIFLGAGGGAGDNLVNSGQISANRYQDAVEGSLYNNGVIALGANTRISNLAGGTITASGTEGAGVRLGIGANGTIVTNDGLIDAATWYGVDFSSLGAAETGRLNNNGMVRGLQGSFFGNDSADAVVNRGTMVGDVYLNDNIDRFDGRGGRVEGEIFGGDGGDVIDLRGGFVSGNPFGGAISGDGGNDLIRGGDLGDVIWGGSEDDTLSGGGGDDVIDGGSGNTLAYGGAGNDTFQVDFEGGGRFAEAMGGEGDDTFAGGGDVDVIYGGAGDDLVYGGSGSDYVAGDGGDDKISNGLGNARLFGGTGLDTITGGDGNDTLDGGSGDDVLDGGNDNDVMTGSFGEDVLTGGIGNDTLDGGNQDDNLSGSGGNDVLRGGRGADVLTGETGRDTMTGGAGGISSSSP